MEILLTIQAILAVLLILCILLQHRANGLTSTTAMNTSIVQRRGAEKLLYQATFVLALAFFGLTVVEWYV